MSMKALKMPLSKYPLTDMNENMRHPIYSFFCKKMESVLHEREKNGKIQIPDKDTPIKIDEDAQLTFVVFGDNQVSNYMYARECCFYSACLDIGNIDSPLDALIIVGDIAENGMKCEYEITSRILNGISDKFNNFIACTGNHDLRLRPYKKQQKRFISFCRSVKNSVSMPDDRYYFSCEIKGYRFIVIGSDRASFEGSYISKKQLDWLDSQIASADSGKPVFVINHQTLKNTNGLPDTWLGKGKWRGSIGWQSDKVRRIFEKYDNVVFISGHLHFGTNEHSYEDCGRFKAVSVQTVGAGNHGITCDESQGMVFSVYKDKIIVRARKFGEGKYFDENTPNFEFEIKL